MGVKFYIESEIKKNRKIEDIKKSNEKVMSVFNDPTKSPHQAYVAILKYLEENFGFASYSISKATITQDIYFLRIRDYSLVSDLELKTALWANPNPKTNRFNVDGEPMLYALYNGKRSISD